MKAIGMITVVMMVSGLRVMWRSERPSRTAVSPRKCLFIIVPCPFWSHEGEEDVLKGRLLLDVLDLGGWEERLELMEGAVHDDPALVEDRDPVGELLRLVEVLSREQHGRAAPGGFVDGLPPPDAPLRGQPGGRLVEEDDRRIPDETHRDVQTAAHATGVRRYPPGARLGQRE